MIIFGQRASNIGSFVTKDTRCDHCNNTGTQQFSVFGKYAHIFWIPTFPLGRKAFAECTHCKRTLDKKNFSPALKQQYDNGKHLVKRPVWHWAGLILFGVLVVAIAFMGT